MKTTTLLKSLFLAIVLSITALAYAQDEPTIPEVTTMEEVITALGDNDQVAGVRVHFKNLEPIFVVKSLYTDIYMPDGTTLLNIRTVCPSKFDAIGRYFYNDDKESGAIGFKFEVEEITAGAISRKIMMISMAIGVSLSVGLSMSRVIFDYSIWYILVPGYLIAI